MWQPSFTFLGKRYRQYICRKAVFFLYCFGGASSLVYAEYESAKKSPLFRTHISMDFCVVWYCSFLILCGHWNIDTARNHKRSLEGYFFRYHNTKPAKRIYSFRMWQPDRIPFVFKTGSQNKTKTKRSIITAVFGVFFCNVLLIFLAVRTLGKTLTTQSAWPVIKMMQLIRMSGGFLERFDILPAIVWVFCMMAVISGYLYYGKKMLEQLLFKKIKKTNPERNDRDRNKRTLSSFLCLSCGKTTIFVEFLSEI